MIKTLHDCAIRYNNEMVKIIMNTLPYAIVRAIQYNYMLYNYDYENPGMKLYHMYKSEMLLQMGGGCWQVEEAGREGVKGRSQKVVDETITIAGGGGGR